MLVVQFETLQVKQIQVAKAKTPVAVVISQLDQPCCNLFILCIKLARLAVTIIAVLKCSGDYPNTKAPFLDCFHGNLLTSKWPHHFFLASRIRSRI